VEWKWNEKLGASLKRLNVLENCEGGGGTGVEGELTSQYCIETR
jgi:hypothetical protein